jgi:hypothetical protein
MIEYKVIHFNLILKPNATISCLKLSVKSHSKI